MSFKVTIDRLRTLGVPDAAIPGVMEMIDEREAEARRPRTNTERSRVHREVKRNENATKSLQERSEIVSSPLPERCADVAPALPDPAPLARVFSIGEVSNIPPEKATLSTPKGGKQKSDRGTRLSDDWRPDDEGRALAVSLLGSNAAAHAELAIFRDYWRAKPGAAGRKTDWDMTWRNWVRKAAQRLQARAPPFGTRNGKPSIQDFAKADYDRLHKPDLPDFGDSPGGLRSLPRG